MGIFLYDHNFLLCPHCLLNPEIYPVCKFGKIRFYYIFFLRVDVIFNFQYTVVKDRLHTRDTRLSYIRLRNAA